MGYQSVYSRLFLVWLAIQSMACETEVKSSFSGITHGPILGHITSSSVRMWARTEAPASVKFTYWEKGPDQPQRREVTSRSTIKNDYTTWVDITGLKSNTTYQYGVSTSEGTIRRLGTFTTLPAPEQFADETYNPDGRFNFSFEFASCANQSPEDGIGYELPAYTTMLEQLPGKINFSIANGDWLYEESREYPLQSWVEQVGIEESDIPQAVRVAPTLVGVWENYKTYLGRASNLSQWHRQVPSYFTFDDHELINDIWGAGTPGRVDRRAVFRDIGTAAWYDYLGWANPTEFQQDVHFGKARLRAGSDTLTDTQANFTQLAPPEWSNLHVHWGTPTAGVDAMRLDSVAGDPNAGVYSIEEVLDDHRVRISPSARADGEASYSIGRRSYNSFTVANCDFYLLDTRSHRQWHNVRERDQPGLSILGYQQRDWLMQRMRESKADFFFVVSSVPFMVPHIGGGGYEFDEENKDEAWTVFLDEREKLIRFWETLDKPVFVLTGDLHNSFAIKITDNIWEFCSGPLNSVNHTVDDEGGRPATGRFAFDQREMDIRWSSYVLSDIPREERLYPHYCVVQVNNVFNNPKKLGEERWVAYEHPQVIFQYFDGRTGELKYAEAVSTPR